MNAKNGLMDGSRNVQMPVHDEKNVHNQYIVELYNGLNGQN